MTVTSICYCVTTSSYATRVGSQLQGLGRLAVQAVLGAATQCQMMIGPFLFGREEQELESAKNECHNQTPYVIFHLQRIKCFSPAVDFDVENTGKPVPRIALELEKLLSEGLAATAAYFFKVFSPESACIPLRHRGFWQG